jgi:hypothetical protein
MAYNGRRGPNVSEYIANLNAIPTAQDIENSQDNFNLDDDLAMFTDTQFFDFDLNQSADLQASNFGEGQGQAPTAAEGSDMKSLDFDLQGTEALFTIFIPIAITALGIRIFPFPFPSPSPTSRQQVVISWIFHHPNPNPHPAASPIQTNAYQDTRAINTAAPLAWLVWYFCSKPQQFVLCYARNSQSRKPCLTITE